MTDARPTRPTPVPSERNQTPAHAMGRASPMEWRRLLKVGDPVAVYCGSIRYPDSVVTSAPETFVTIGKYKGRLNFNRRTGKLATRRPLAHLFRIEAP